MEDQMQIHKLHARALCGGAGMAAVLALTLVTAQAAPKTRFTAAQANAIVLKRFPGKLTGKTVLENEEGSWQYGVMVQSGRTLREVMVDANSGKIVDIEKTTVAKERAEKRAEAAHRLSTHHAGK